MEANHEIFLYSVTRPVGFLNLMFFKRDGDKCTNGVSESLDIASGMLLFFIRFVIVMVPIFVFVLLPAGLVIRYLIRRAKRIRLAQALATPSAL